MVAQNRIKDYLKIYKISDELVNFIEKTMKNWKLEFTAVGTSLAVAKIQTSIFQDALSPLLSIIAMMTLNHIFRKCIAI